VVIAWQLLSAAVWSDPHTTFPVCCHGHFLDKVPPPDHRCDVSVTLLRAPTHGFQWTRRLVQQAFGLPLEQLFDSFDMEPLASGSIAQVAGWA
jgi:hypothetical protein